ncbi:hypothetical protein [Streptomyces narbonensis]
MTHTAYVTHTAHKAEAAYVAHTAYETEVAYAGTRPADGSC